MSTDCHRCDLCGNPADPGKISWICIDYPAVAPDRKPSFTILAACRGCLAARDLPLEPKEPQK